MATKEWIKDRIKRGIVPFYDWVPLDKRDWLHEQCKQWRDEKLRKQALDELTQLGQDMGDYTENP